MRSIPLPLPLGITVSPTTTSPSSLSNNNKKKNINYLTITHHHHHHHGFYSSYNNNNNLLSHLIFRSGICRASQMVELFPAVSPEIVVREARIEDCWEVAETHCSSFFPEFAFPLDFVLRVDRLVAMLAGFSLPPGCKRSCLVAVLGNSVDDAFVFGNEDLKIGGFDGKVSLNRGYVTGILTVDTVADFLPRKGPLRQKRSGIAYISNVAVRDKYRRKGIAKKLIAKAEVQARSWGCRSVALHCDLDNPAAIKLYKDQGFKCIKVPEGAKWPQPRISPDVEFNFMMKLL